MNDMTPKCTLLVDGTNIAMFAAFGGKIPWSMSTNSALIAIERAASKANATRIIVALDADVPSFRKKLNPTYKLGRTTNTQPYVDDLAHRCKYRQWATVVMPGYEADDILASLAEQITGRIVILSSDSDVLACVTERVTVYRPKKIRESHEWDLAMVRQHYGIEPFELPAYKALVGEPGDNITGIPGIGPKTAVKLLRSHDYTIEAQQHLKQTLPLTKLVDYLDIPRIIEEGW